MTKVQQMLEEKYRDAHKVDDKHQGTKRTNSVDDYILHQDSKLSSPTPSGKPSINQRLPITVTDGNT